MTCKYEKKEMGEVTKHVFYYCLHPEARPKIPFCNYTLDEEKCPLIKLDKIEIIKKKHRTHLMVHSTSFLKELEPLLEES